MPEGKTGLGETWRCLRLRRAALETVAGPRSCRCAKNCLPRDPLLHKHLNQRGMSAGTKKTAIAPALRQAGLLPSRSTRGSSQGHCRSHGTKGT